MMWLRFATLAAALTLICHLVVLTISGLDAIRTPISALSSARLGGVHTLGIVLFGAGHLALAHALGGMDRGKLWPIARGLLAASGIALFYVAFYFATSDSDTLQGASANDPLWVVATLTGLAMGALQPGLARVAPQVGMFSTICLGIWLWFVPVTFWVNDSWIGGYERMVGGIYVLWLAGVAIGLSQRPARATS